MERERIRHPGSAEIILWGSRGLPGGLDALIVPEDTHLLLQAVTEELDPDATPLDLWAALERAARLEKRPLGSVIIADGRTRGVKYIARVIMVDLDDEPICRIEVVLAGLHDALSELANRDCETVGIFAFGRMQGGVSVEAYLEALTEVRTRLGGESPGTLYLLRQDHASPEKPGA
jgi:hypothetical protein